MKTNANQTTSTIYLSLIHIYLSKAVRGILYAIPVQLVREHLILPLGSPSIKNSFIVLPRGIVFPPLH